MSYFHYLLSLLFFILLLYFTTEDWAWHKSAAAEERFWGVWMVSLICVVVYTGDILPVERWWWVDWMILWWGFVGLRWILRKTQTSKFVRKRFPSALGNWHLEANPMQEKVNALTKLIEKTEYNFAPTTYRMIDNSSILKRERKIISMFRECTTDEFNYLLLHCNVSRLLHNVQDHRRMSSKKHKTELIAVMVDERLDDMGPIARAALLDALQRSGVVKAHHRGSQWVKTIILSTYGRDLWLLKNLLDNGGDWYSFHKLVHGEVNILERREILAHLSQENHPTSDRGELWIRRCRYDRQLPFAELLRSDEDQLEETESESSHMVKILSDVDDTLYCSGGDGIAGIDKSFNKKDVYPGVLQFYMELDMGPYSEMGLWEEGRCGNLVFLSARPHLYKDVSESASYALFDKLRRNMNLYTNPSLLAGDLKVTTVKMMVGDFTAILEKKFSNFLEYSALYPECKYVFVGDNGQADVKVGEMMYDAKPDHVSAVFIHLCQDVEKTFGASDEGAGLSKWNDLGFVFFKTYVGAAVQAFKRGLIHANGVSRVALAARRELVALSEKLPLAKIAARFQEFNDDVTEANEVTGSTIKLLNVPDVPVSETAKATGKGDVQTNGVASPRGGRDSHRKTVGSVYDTVNGTDAPASAATHERSMSTVATPAPVVTM
eukprot:GFYU01008610.1.p1 GENE.GFYU01008610.1~~GFYU01008610.1.p1  ORF type:complete len:663 (-),score=153.78 GFYU01008610.1:108-2096(-)